MPVSFEPVATLWLTRPFVQWDGKMPYSPLSWTSLPVTRKSSAQKRKMPSPSKPFTVKPRTCDFRIRWLGSSKHEAPSAPGFANAMPCSWPPGFSRTTGAFRFERPRRRTPSFVTTTAHVCAGSVGHGVPASWYVPGRTATVSPGLARFTAAWIDSPGWTVSTFAGAGSAEASTMPTTTSDRIGDLLRLLELEGRAGHTACPQRGSSRAAPSAREPGVLALEEEEGPPAPHLGVLHLADVDHVVAALVGLDDPALDVRERPLQDERSTAAG